MVKLLNSDEQSKQRKLQSWREWKDDATTWGIKLGGISVMLIIVLIFFYLLWIALPLFFSAHIEPAQRIQNSALAAGNTQHLLMNEHATIGAKLTDHAQALFFNLSDGQLLNTTSILQPGQHVSSFAVGDAFSNQFGYGLTEGSVWLTQVEFKVHFEGDERQVVPSFYAKYPEPLEIQAEPVSVFGYRDGEEQLTVVSAHNDALVIASFSKEVSFLDETVELDKTTVTLPLTAAVKKILIGPNQHWVYVLTHKDQLLVYNIADLAEIEPPQQVSLVQAGDHVTQLAFLTGSISLMVGTEQGHVTQWFLVRDAQERNHLRQIRALDTGLKQIVSMAVEHRRKGLVVSDDQGQMSLLYTTSDLLLLTESVATQPLRAMSFSPRADVLLSEIGDGVFLQFHIDNEHPEISWQALWGKVWYESYPEPDYVWQSSSADNDFEPKLSLTPLSFGTFKAAFYAMLIAIPLAVFGAIYTAYFMAPKMRTVVKPTIEIMEALPTVVLGFLAGLWLAPVIELYMPAIFSLLLFLPLVILGFGFFWQSLPEQIQHRIPEGWHGALLIPVILLVGYVAFAMSHTVENLFFNGDMRVWLTDDLGIDFDQRNALIIGIAMGFAVIPTIFSIAEDAIFSVPRHLTNGSLALGATTWQTMVKVVLPTASPGIFSGVMMGFGRAVGETMIVLMATGNTPIMDMNIFEGMRTLAANIAVEMPEAEVASTHFRVLFLAALVLFLFTFVLNTLAEIVRQRLRNKYGKM